MLEGLYSAAAGMSAQQQQLDAISNDLANVSTTGYQAQRVGFENLLYSPSGLAGSNGVADGAGAAAVSLGASQVQGPMNPTGQPLDVALNGPGYIEVRTSTGGVGLTRDGQLQVDGKGQLTTAAGNFLAPPINIPVGTDPKTVTIGSDGTVTAAGRKLGKLSIVNVPAPAQLTAAGNGLLTPNAASGALTRAGAATAVVQGSLEGSNVDLTTEMVDMMSTQRSYSLGSQAISIQDQMLQIANGVKR